jgi:hypothetical protein
VNIEVTKVKKDKEFGGSAIVPQYRRTTGPNLIST